MKKLFLAIAFALMAVTGCFAQINLYPLATGKLCEDNKAAADVLVTRMRNMISRSGMIASNVEGRFVLAAKADILQRELTATVPQNHVLVLLVSFAIGDGYTGTSYGSTSVEIKGVGQSEERAFLNALKAVKANKDLTEIIKTAQARILEYYEQNGPNIINNAKGLIAAHKWDEACAQLYAIPSECSCYPEACDLMSQAVQAYSNYNSTQMIAEAENLWASNPTSENAAAVMEMIKNVDTDSPAYAKAVALREKVQKRFEAEEKRQQFLEERAHREAREDAAAERADRNAQAQREYNLEARRIYENGKTQRAVANAAASVANAYYRSHRVTYHVHSWW